LIRYEDLAAEPERTLGTTLGYLGVNLHSETASRMLADAEHNQPPESKQFHQTSGSTAASVGRWRRDLTPAQKSACAAIFDDILTQFGYEPTGPAPRPKARSSDGRGRAGGSEAAAKVR
jgi:hypothetical protein